MKTHLSVVLLDIDGTLIDSNDAHALAWKKTLDQLGIRNSFVEIRRTIGMGSDKLIPKLTGLAPDSSRAKDISAHKSEIFRTEFIKKIQSFPKTGELLSKLKSDHLRLIAVSSGEEKDLNDTLERLELRSKIDLVISHQDAPHSKPDPDLIESALRKAKVSPSHAMMLGDTPYDIEAAQRAHVGIVALRSGGWTDSELKGALAIYDDPEDLLENYESSPFHLQAASVSKKIVNRDLS